MTERSSVNKAPAHKTLRIIEKNNDGSWRRVVHAPLMDGFGMSVGSAFTDPSNNDLADAAGSLGRVAGALGQAAKWVARSQGYSTKISQQSNTWYAGPEPTEISFDMIFNSYYSAYDDVIVPAVKLMLMSVGREHKIKDLNERLTEELKAAGSDSSVASEDVAETAGQFGFVKSAGVCQVDFGKTFKIPRAYVSSVGVKFSNVLDNQGYPTSAECAVTIKVIRNPTQNEIGEQYFGMPGI